MYVLKKWPLTTAPEKKIHNLMLRSLILKACQQSFQKIGKFTLSVPSCLYWSKFRKVHFQQINQCASYQRGKKREP